MSRRWVAGLALLAAGTVVIWLPLARNGFILADDTTYLTNNPAVAQGFNATSFAWALTTFHGANWHPLTWWSHLVDVSLFGLNPAGHHLMSLGLHLANVILTAILLGRLTGGRVMALTAAALFGWHPLRVESVAWAAERKDLLAALFMLLALHAWLARLRGGRTAWGTVSLVMYAAALMAKPSPICLPLLMLVLDWWPLGRSGTAGSLRRWWPLLLEKMGFFLLAVASGLITLAAQRSGGAIIGLRYYSVWARLSNVPVALVRYLAKTVWPADLSVFYPLAPGRSPLTLPCVITALVVLAFLSAVVVRARRRAPWILAGGLWFLASLAPVLGIVQVGYQAMADRYAYLPHLGLIGLALAGGSQVRPWGRRSSHSRWILVVVLAAVLWCLAWATRSRIALWHDDLSLFGQAAALDRDNWFAHNNLGLAFLEKGNAREALDHFRAAAALSPEPIPWNNAGLALLRLGRPREAVDAFRTASRAFPEAAEFRFNLAVALAESGRPDGAMEEYLRIIAVAPRFSRAEFNLADLLSAQGRHAEAEAHYRRYLNLDPASADAWNNLGAELFRLGRVAEAAQCWRRALEVDPGHAEARSNLKDLAGRPTPLTSPR